MTDKKMLEAELQHIQSYFEAKANMSIGDGKMKLLSWANAVRDAAELLKEKEPMPVMVTKNTYNFEFYHCPNCGREFYSPFYSSKPLYCDQCGQAVKFDADT